MKPTISKALVCGILASSFIIINCQKAPSRGVKADTQDPNAKQTAAQLPVCNEAVVAAKAARSPLYKEIDEIVKAQAQPNAEALADDKKVELSDKADKLDEKTQELIQKIRAMGNPKAPVEACKHVGATPDLEATIAIADLNSEDKKLAEKVAQLSGATNLILERAAHLMEAGKEFLLKAALADLMSNKTAINGEKAVAEGQILAKEQYESLKSNKDKTSCVLSTASQSTIAADTKAKIMIIEVTAFDESLQRAKANVRFEIKGEGSSSTMVEMACAIAQNKGISDELTAAFGEMLALPAAPVAPQAAGPVMVDPAPPTSAQTAPATAPSTEPAPAPAQAPQQPAPAPAAAPQFSQQQVQEAEDTSALVHNLNQGH